MKILLVLNVINEMPESFSVDEIMYKLYIINRLLAKLHSRVKNLGVSSSFSHAHSEFRKKSNNHEKAMQDIKNGRVYSTDEVRQFLFQKSGVGL